MKLLAIMPVETESNPFDLYFYAYTDDEPPDSNPQGVANREWLYQRPYAVVELQHHRSHNRAGEGFDYRSQLEHIRVTTDQPLGDLAARLDGISARRLDTSSGLACTSPDGHQFLFR